MYCFPSNLHLTFRLTAFLSPFSRLISFEEIIFELHQRLTDSDDMTHTTRRAGFDGTRHLLPQPLLCAGNNVSRIVFDKLTTNCVDCVVCLQAVWKRNSEDAYLKQLQTQVK